MSETRGYLSRPDGERLAWRQVAGAGPTLVWLGGFRSDMAGTKAEALADWALAQGRAYLRFDYLGHGESGGDFQAKGTITRWREDALAVLDELVEGPAVLVGSSMGGWIACLAAMARPQRVSALVLVAPAPDFTEKLMAPEIPPEGQAALRQDGVWLRPSDYGEPYPITRALLEDGARWSILPGPVPIEVPVRILQGGDDPDVPWRHALELTQGLKSADVAFTLIKDGDHRLSRPQDIERLLAAVAEVAG
ncbi:alpha/beta hydrolase [Phenylobacterium hankyongense]|uniref:Palmitoyl-protein thioesterase ABHD10, mitochondrial n=1 Tax=Phenylobacterium hankyongense TaxID=1813876 RepID=A0A328AZ17_9CAUL|nr:alpha/beta hydrolase [Phenylobacterium hankyongense]RAK58916.1 alpha/beta hydrolase [Phenylobacterium hankyongense]